MRVFCLGVGAYSYCYIVSAIFAAFGSCCYYIKACCEHIESIFNECDDMVDIPLKSRDEQVNVLVEKMRHVVSIHIKIME